ncbi:hypothetical protein [Phenylobacterium sp.]|uniref:hypothetical protein n=1 Tax=Phenylobacterium sp. TaxID=1871053 RepID=UPI0035613553
MAADAARAAKARRRSARRGLVTAALSVAGHGLAILALLTAHRDSPKPLVEPEPMTVALVDVPPAVEPPAPPAPAPPEPPKPPPPRNLARPTKADRPDARPIPARDAPIRAEGVELSDAQVASASAAGAGAGGRPCDMARRLQTALRKDRLVQAAVADADRVAGSSGKAHYIWNGDWVQSRGQDGNGLAAVREAIMWEVAFAPEACRAEPVHGLVLFSLNDAPGSARLVVGSGEWRWSDMLRPRGGG